MSLTTKTKTIRAHVCSATNPTAFPRELKIAPTTLPTIAANASTAFPASLLSASANLSNHFFKIPSTFGGEPVNFEVLFKSSPCMLCRALSIPKDSHIS